MITAIPFGTLSDGTPVTLYHLEGVNGGYAEIMDYGATTHAIVVPDRDGRLTDVILGYETAQGYEKGDLFFGATVGRHANRIGKGCFTLNGTTYQLERNDGENHLHGGYSGFHQRMFRAEICGETLKLSLVSPDGDQGYPGELKLTVSFSFADNGLDIRYEAECDKDTVVNLTNHSYFDLSGGVNPMGQMLKIRSAAVTENDAGTLPTGNLLPVRGTPFDFTEEKPVGRDLEQDHIQLKNCGGYDHNFVLNKGGLFEPCALLTSPETGIAMETFTDMPGLQLYSGNCIKPTTGKGGRIYGPRAAICLESQFFPNAMAVPAFQKPILRAGERYAHRTCYRFFVRSSPEGR